MFLAMVVLATLSLALLGCDSADGPAVSNNEGGQPAVAGCAEAADCGAGQLCSGGVCVAETAPEGPGNVCETDGDCADGQICQQGACLADENPEVPATGCTSDDQCTQGLKCIEGDCVYVAEPDPPEEPCTTDADCGKEQGCIQGSCVDVDDPGPPEEGCDSNDDCEDEETCEDGVCVDDSGPPPIETCASDADCPEGKSCFAGICIEDEPTDPPVDECVFDSDCGPGQSCSEGACIDKGDEPDPPDPEETDCATDADCEDPTHKCTASEACPPPLPGGGPGMECLGICVPKEQGDSCFSDNECPEGLMCTCGPGGGWGPPPNALMPCNLQCMPEDPDDWGCVSDWDCKEGETCDAGECIPGGPITECIISGCSGEICAPMPGLSDCMWDPEYACLSQSECGNFGPGGSCGWKETDLYLQCLEDIGGGPDDGGCQADTDCGDPSLKCFIDPFCEDLPSEFNPGGSGPCRSPPTRRRCSTASLGAPSRSRPPSTPRGRRWWSSTSCARPTAKR